MGKSRANGDRDPDVDEIFRRVRRLELIGAVGLALIASEHPLLLKLVALLI